MLVEVFIAQQKDRIQDGVFNKVECGDTARALGYSLFDMHRIATELTTYITSNNFTYEFTT
jgi:hypothetical protein